VYLSVHNNPINHIDPLGLQDDGIFATAWKFWAGKAKSGAKAVARTGKWVGSKVVQGGKAVGRGIARGAKAVAETTSEAGLAVRDLAMTGDFYAPTQVLDQSRATLSDAVGLDDPSTRIRGGGGTYTNQAGSKVSGHLVGGGGSFGVHAAYSDVDLFVDRLGFGVSLEATAEMMDPASLELDLFDFTQTNAQSIPSLRGWSKTAGAEISANYPAPTIFSPQLQASGAAVWSENYEGWSASAGGGMSVPFPGLLGRVQGEVGAERTWNFTAGDLASGILRGAVDAWEALTE